LSASSKRAKPKSAGGRAILSRPSSPAGDGVGLDGHGPEDLAEGDGHERVVDAAAVRDEESYQQTGNPSGEDRREKASPQIRAEVELREPEGIRSDAEVRAVAEGDEPGGAHHQVEGEGVDRPDEDLDAEVGVEPGALDPEGYGSQEKPNRDHCRRDQASFVHTSSRLFLPNRPRARNDTTATSRM
jgi:hypothetical protein